MIYKCKECRRFYKDFSFNPLMINDNKECIAANNLYESFRHELLEFKDPILSALFENLDIVWMKDPYKFYFIFNTDYYDPSEEDGERIRCLYYFQHNNRDIYNHLIKMTANKWAPLFIKYFPLALNQYEAFLFEENPYKNFAGDNVLSSLTMVELYKKRNEFLENMGISR